MSDDQKMAQSGETYTLGRVLDKSSADAASHRIRFDKEIIEFSVVSDWPPGGESEELAVLVDGDAHSAIRNSSRIDAEDVGVCIQVRGVLRPDV